MSKPEWSVYLVRCKGGQLYTGIATDVERRLGEHEAGKGSKYLRGKAPLQLVFQQKIGSRSAALKCEAAIKKYSKADKEKIITLGNRAILLPCFKPDLSGRTGPADPVHFIHAYSKQ